MIKTSFTSKEPAGILNEFFRYHNNAFIKGMPFQIFRKKILEVIQRIIENQGINYCSNEKGLRTHLFTCMMLKSLKKLQIPENLNLCWNFKRFMRQKAFRKLYLCALNILFSQDFIEISALLNIQCCTGRSHFNFCRQKWEELFSFAEKGMLKIMKIKRVTRLKIDLFMIQPDPDDFLAN
jgi:hypothetical protein